VVGNIGFAFNALGAKTLKEGIKNTYLWVKALITGKKVQDSMENTPSPSVSEKTKPTRTSTKKGGGFLKDLKGLSAEQMLASAAAILAIAGAIWILSYAFLNFEKVSSGGFAIGIGAMAAFTGMVYAIVPALKALTSVSGSLLPAIGILLAISAAVVGIGYGLSLMGNAFKDASLDKMAQFAIGMVAFAGSVLMLASALSMLGNPMALLGLGVLAAAGGIGIAIAGSTGKTEANTDTLAKSKTTESGYSDLIKKIEDLTVAIMAQPIELKLDTSVVAKSVRKDTSKTLAPGKP
jgi:hypothetical protein